MVKKSDVVICAKNTIEKWSLELYTVKLNLTVGRGYVVHDIRHKKINKHPDYLLKNNSGEMKWYPADCFVKFINKEFS